ncbi:tRNA 2-selenouridine(34) synthase MnmH [Parachryseolinea silvisoli]|uniref:tRNA 2-selenouridine(34) synthase MnmH n=1 Tax=Parachryseolinea silvisoli TaxID=2873601 RepID=UPI002265F48E|nr:tRNA 2-selenouridine(34) synthase MnmH [Parachryseolinea silvisoli]
MCLQASVPLADVRTPAEFAQGHVPGAFNLPLFSNEERITVGTTYKQVGKEAAILLGFDLTGPKWSGFIRQALAAAPQKKIAVHCWRGGMRSGAMAWALDLYGFEVYLLQGGYKQYRRWVLDQFEVTYALVVLGGMTGSGKTRILHELQTLGEQVIDLEALAQHQGSSYGSLNKLVQPTQEQFENNLARQLRRLDRQRYTWVEDESSTIGKCMIPRPVWNQLTGAFLVDIQMNATQRIEALVREYGALDRDFLIAGTERIRKRLGHDHARNAITAIQEGRMEDFIREVLTYYDKTYRTSLAQRTADRILTVVLKDQANHHDNARVVRQAFEAVPPVNK